MHIKAQCRDGGDSSRFDKSQLVQSRKRQFDVEHRLDVEMAQRPKLREN